MSNPSASRLFVARFGGRIYCHSLHVPAFAVEVLEVFDPAVNKWEGILHVARHHDIEPEQIIAIGDDVNDVPMPLPGAPEPKTDPRFRY